MLYNLFVPGFPLKISISITSKSALRLYQKLYLENHQMMCKSSFENIYTPWYAEGVLYKRK